MKKFILPFQETDACHYWVDSYVLIKAESDDFVLDLIIEKIERAKEQIIFPTYESNLSNIHIKIGDIEIGLHNFINTKGVITDINLLTIEDAFHLAVTL